MRNAGPFVRAPREKSISVTAMIGTGLIATPTAKVRISLIPSAIVQSPVCRPPATDEPRLLTSQVHPQLGLGSVISSPLRWDRLLGGWLGRSSPRRAAVASSEWGEPRSPADSRRLRPAIWGRSEVSSWGRLGWWGSVVVHPISLGQLEIRD
jgi:hypothetical protein